MRDAGRRPAGRLCCWVVMGVMSCVFWLTAGWAQSGPATTTVSDTVYLADGSIAQGIMIISWPAFQTASGSPIAAGNTTVTIASNGTFSVGLVSNVGATPAGVYYTVIYQLGPGQVRTEYWVVPTTSPANLATVRTTPGSGIAAQPASVQFVNSALAAKANDNAVVHLANAETITGAKTFTASPNVPTPTGSGQVASKGYVDQAVSNVGSGNFLSTAGGTMTGPITLPGSPAAPLQAATKQYVDTGLASKADLISGLVPTGELGTGLANSSSCLLGNGTWGACAAGGNLSTTPATSQNIAQPAGTNFSTNNLANIRYVTPSWNWAQTPADNLSTPGNLTIHLSPCPLGIDTTSSANNYIYRVYISGQGTPEAVTVTGGSCSPGATSGTITVTTAFAHSAGYTVGSATSGIQEAWNDAWTGDSASTASSIAAPYVKLMADLNYNVYSTIYLRGRGGMLDGAGAFILCSTRDRCIYIGTPVTGIGYHKLYNVTAGSLLNIDGAQVANISATSGNYTITTATNHPFVVGDTAACEYHSQTADQRWVAQVTSVPNATTFTVTVGNGTVASPQNIFGFCNILNTFIENGSDHVALQDIQVIQANPIAVGYFSYGVTDDNDQQFIIERASNRATGVVKNTANWPLGAFFYQRTDQGNAGIMYVHNSELTNVNCADGGGNGFVITDSVCQGFPVFGIRYFGGLQPSTYQNLYEESTGGTTNPLYAGSLPSQMGILMQGGFGHRILGTFPIAGYTPTFASGGGGAAQRNYYVVPRSSVQGYGAMWYIGSAQPSSGSVNINLQWPSIELQDGFQHQSLGTLNWDILVTTGTASAPYGTGTFAVATNVSGSCNTGGICSYTDTQQAPSSYTVQPQGFTPALWFWPSNVALNGTTVMWDVGATNPGVVATQGIQSVAVTTPQCDSLNPNYTRSPVIVSCETITNTFQSTLWPTLNGIPANSKGRLNLGQYPAPPNDLITLYDSNFAKTAATAGARPSADAGDMALGADQVGGLSERASTSITSYINVLPNGTNYQERLTAAAKTINVPLTVNGGFTVSSGNVTLPITGSGSQCLHVSSTGVLSGTGADCGTGSGSGGSGTVNVGSTSQLALYSGNAAAVSGDSVLTDNGTTLNYGGSGGIAAAAGTFSGNLTVNGQLLVAGPWAVSSPVPGTPMGPAGTGTSSLGISNDGNFYISANGGTPQKVATSATSSFFSNLFQEDANDVGMYNGTNGQALHVYGTYTNASNYERTGIGWDATDNYFVLRNENTGTGQQRGIGFWIGSSIRWAIDTASAFKPFLNNTFDIGVISPAPLVPRTVYAGTSFDTLTQGRLNFELCNDGTTGTSLNFLAIYNGTNPACAVKAGTSNTDGVIGVVSNGSGTTGNAVITYRGYVPCSFDGSTTAGDYVVASTTNPGDCHDTGLGIRPIGVQVLGRVESTNSTLGTYGVRLSLDAPIAGTFLDASQQAGSTLDIKLNNANALAITNGIGTIDARALGGAQTIASEVSIGELRPPVLSAVSGTSPGAGTYKVVYTLTSPTATETSASMESTVTITGSQAIQVASPTYYGTATSYNVYVTPVGAAGMGTVNASGATVTWVSGQQFTTGSAWSGQKIIINGVLYTISSVSSATSLTVNGTVGTLTGGIYSTGNWSELKCTPATNVAVGTNATISAACGGAAVSSSNAGFGVALIPPHTGVWTVTDTNGATDCGLKFFDQAAFWGDHAGEGRPWYLTSNSSTNVAALVCTDPNPKKGGGYYSIRGMSARGTSGDSIQTATCVIFGPYDVSVFDDMDCETDQTYPAALVYAWGSGASTRISGEFMANGVGQPLVIGQVNAGLGDIDFHDMAVNHPGNSYPNIAIVGTITGPIHFTGTLYMEGPPTGSCSAPIQIATQTNVSSPIIFDAVHQGGYCPSTSAYLFSVPSTFFVSNLTVGPIYTGNFTNLFNYGPNSSLNISAVGTQTTHPGFTLDLNNPRMVLTNFQVLGTTSLAAATATTPATSDNSTNVATTAFVKNQGYATLASPALTGTPTAVTVSAGDNSTKIATTAYVDGNYLPTSLAWGHNFNSTTTVPFNTSTGHMNVFGIFLSQPVKTSQITLYVVTADNSANTYDIGLFYGVSGSSNNLIAHTGAVAGSSYFATGSSFTTISFGSTVILQPGRYYLALYANEASAPVTLASNASSDVEFYHFNAANVTPASGGLPSSFTGPTDGYTTSAAPVFVLH